MKVMKLMVQSVICTFNNVRIRFSNYLVNTAATAQAAMQINSARALVQTYPAFSGSQIA